MQSLFRRYAATSNPQASATAALRHLAPLGVAAFAFVAALPSSGAARGKPKPPPPSPVACADLATNPAHGLAGNPVVKSVNSLLIAPAGTNLARIMHQR
jgi:hypothetical protein